MASIQIAFSDRAIRTKATKEGRYIFGPGHNGLFMNVNEVADGKLSKCWAQYIYIKGAGEEGKSKRRELGLGTFPRVGVAAVAELAGINADLADQGIDPREYVAPDDLPDFKTVALQIVGQRCTLQDGDDRPRWRATTEYRMTNILKNHVYPDIGDKRIDQIGKSDLFYLIDLHSKSPKPAKDAASFIKNVFDRCINEYSDHITVNPIDSAFMSQMTNRRNRRHHAALLPADLPAAIPLVQQNTKHDIALRAMNQAVMITGVRMHSAENANWKELQWKEIRTKDDWNEEGWEPVDWDNVEGSTKTILWRIPEDHMKMSKAFDTPVAPQLLDIFKEMWAIRGQGKRNPELIFASPRGGKFGRTASLNLLQELPFKSDRPGKCLTPHGFRSTFRTWAADHEVDNNVAESQLAHEIDPKFQDTYMRSPLLEQRTRLMQAYADYAYGTLPADWIWIQPEVQAQIDAGKERAEVAERRALEAERRADKAEQQIAEMRSEIADLTEMVKTMMGKMAA